MRELLDTLDLWRAEGAGVGRAVLIRTFTSAPRPEGAVHPGGMRSGRCFRAGAGSPRRHVNKDWELSEVDGRAGAG